MLHPFKQSIHNTNFKKDYVRTAYLENEVKLFNMLQDMHTNHPQQKYVNISINSYHKKKCAKSIIIITFIKNKNKNLKLL